MLARQTGDLGHGLEHAGLVVGELNRDQNPLVARPLQAGREPGEIDDAVPIDRDDLDRMGREAVAVEAAGVLGGARREASRPLPDPSTGGTTG
jgi:hypothetical protein